MAERFSKARLLEGSSGAFVRNYSTYKRRHTVMWISVCNNRFITKNKVVPRKTFVLIELDRGFFILKILRR